MVKTYTSLGSIGNNIYHSISGSLIDSSAYETMYEDDFLGNENMPWMNPNYLADVSRQHTDIRWKAECVSYKEGVVMICRQYPIASRSIIPAYHTNNTDIFYLLLWI